jgi:hypothetical protein
MRNGLSTNGVWFKAIDAPRESPATIVLNDKGKKAAASDASERINRSEQVMALDLTFVGDAYTGDAWKGGDPPSYAQIVDALGDRTVGLEAAQLIAAARWLRDAMGARGVRLQTTGIRSQVVALVAAGLEPTLFSELAIREGMESLGYALDVPVHFEDAPELFCLDLYKYFDLDRLAIVAAPTKIVVQKSLQTHSKG